MLPDDPLYQSDRQAVAEPPPLSELRLRAVLRQVLRAAEESAYPLDVFASYFASLCKLPTVDMELMNRLLHEEIRRWNLLNRPVSEVRSPK
jgi:hypothetical protein